MRPKLFSRTRPDAPQVEAVLAITDPRQRREGRQGFRQHHRPGARPAAAMGGGEGLVQVDVHGVDARSPGPHAADDGVEIGAVAVEIAAGGVDGVGDGFDVGLEQRRRCSGWSA